MEDFENPPTTHLWIDPDFLTELGLANLSEKDKLELMELLDKRFMEVIVATTIDNMNDFQLRQFMYALEHGEYLEGIIASLASSIPGLAEAIDAKIQEEVACILADVLNLT